jgi:hypothetical protein
MATSSKDTLQLNLDSPPTPPGFVVVKIEEGYGSGYNTIYDGSNFSDIYIRSSVERNIKGDVDGYDFIIRKENNWELGRISIDVTIPDGYQETVVDIYPEEFSIDVSRSTTILFRVNSV